METYEKKKWPGADIAKVINRRLERAYPGITKTIDPFTGKINDQLFYEKLKKKFDNDRKFTKRHLKFPDGKYILVHVVLFD